MYAFNPSATGANAAAAAPPESGSVVPIFTVPVILSLTSGGQFEVSTLYGPPCAVPSLPALAPPPVLVLLSLLHAAAAIASAARSTIRRAGLLRVIKVPLGLEMLTLLSQVVWLELLRVLLYRCSLPARHPGPREGAARARRNVARCVWRGRRCRTAQRTSTGSTGLRTRPSPGSDGRAGSPS